MKKVWIWCNECGHKFLSTPFKENVEKPCPKCGDKNTELYNGGR